MVDGQVIEQNPAPCLDDWRTVAGDEQAEGPFGNA